MEKSDPAVILHGHFAQLRGHWAKKGLGPMNEQVIEAVAASNSLRATPSIIRSAGWMAASGTL
jgi:hypothetical protein